MVIAAVLLSFVAFVSMGLGVLLMVVPVWGAVCAFGAPTLALIGIVLSGMAISAANKKSQPTGFAIAALVMNVLAFFPSIAVAMTCGVCNALVTTGNVQTNQQLQWITPPAVQPFGSDGGVPPPPPPPPPFPSAAAKDAGANPPSSAPDLPPPPIEPGPTR